MKEGGKFRGKICMLDLHKWTQHVELRVRPKEVKRTSSPLLLIEVCHLLLKIRHHFWTDSAPTARPRSRPSTTRSSLPKPIYSTLVHITVTHIAFYVKLIQKNDILPAQVLREFLSLSTRQLCRSFMEYEIYLVYTQERTFITLPS